MTQSTVEYPKKGVVDAVKEAPVRVLHVDDEADFLKAAKQILEMQGAFQVETATSVEKAMEKIKEKSFDVVVSDYVMPGKNGLDFLKELRDCGNDIPFIMFTGKGREEVAIKALNLGADCYFNKIGGPETVYGELAHGIRQAVESRRAENALLESEEKFRNLAEQSPNMIFVNLKGRVVYANKKCEEKMGYTKEEFYSPDFNFLTLIAPEYSDLLKSSFSRHMKGEEVLPLEYALLTKEGKRIDAILTTKLIRYEGETAILGTVTDITERKKMEAALRKSEEKYRCLVQDTDTGIISVDIEGKFTFVNKAVCEMIGYSEKELLGKSFIGFIHPGDRDRILQLFLDFIQNPESRPSFEFRVVHKEGHLVYLWSSPTIFKYQNKIIGSHAIIINVTERKKTEDALRNSENKYRTLLENLPQKIFFKDKNSVYISCNENYARDLKIKPDEIAGKTDYDFYPKKLAEKYRADDGRLMESGKTEDIEEEYIQDGQKVFVHTVKTPVRDENGDVVGILGIFWNITEQKKMEQELQDAREKWVSLTENTDDVIMILDGKGTIQYLNPTLLTTDPREVIGKSVYEYVPREQHDIMRESLRKVFKTGKPDSYEISPNIQGIGTIWFNTKVVPIKHDKKTVSVILISTDITKRKQAEESLKATLEKVQILNEKLGVVGKLARHDARNKLSTVTMNAFLMKQKTAYDPETLKHLSEIKTACGEIERIFDFARIYEKIGVEELAYMNVEKTLAEAVMLFSDMQGIKVVNDCRGLTVLADSLLRQLFYNLTDNSLKHGENVSQIRVYYEEVGKNRLKLVYEDDGTGIPKDEKEKIFTEGYGKDTGYGLYLIRKMCEVYGWTIKEAGKQGKGAKFTMAMPKTGKSGKDNYRFLKN